MTIYKSTNSNVTEFLEFCETLNSKQLYDVFHQIHTELLKRFDEEEERDNQ